MFSQSQILDRIEIIGARYSGDPLYEALWDAGEGGKYLRKLAIAELEEEARRPRLVKTSGMYSF